MRNVKKFKRVLVKLCSAVLITGMIFSSGFVTAYAADNNPTTQSSGSNSPDSGWQETKGQWYQHKGAYYFVKANGKKACNEWIYVGDDTFCIGPDTYARTGWIETSSGNWYYAFPDTYRLAKNCWLRFSDGWRYFEYNGAMAVADVTIGNTTYKISANGVWTGEKTVNKSESENSGSGDFGSSDPNNADKSSGGHASKQEGDIWKVTVDSRLYHNVNSSRSECNAGKVFYTSDNRDLDGCNPCKSCSPKDPGKVYSSDDSDGSDNSNNSDSGSSSKKKGGIIGFDDDDNSNSGVSNKNTENAKFIINGNNGWIHKVDGCDAVKDSGSKTMQNAKYCETQADAEKTSKRLNADKKIHYCSKCFASEANKNSGTQ